MVSPAESAAGRGGPPPSARVMPRAPISSVGNQDKKSLNVPGGSLIPGCGQARSRETLMDGPECFVCGKAGHCSMKKQLGRLLLSKGGNSPARGVEGAADPNSKTSRDKGQGALEASARPQAKGMLQFAVQMCKDQRHGMNADSHE